MGAENSEGDLFQLVKSLDKEERAYFLRYAGRHVINNGNIYVRLFELILELPGAGEQMVWKRMCQEFPNSKTLTSNFSALKAYLFKAVLQAMREKDRLPDKERQLHNLLDDCKFLLRKRLAGQAGKLSSRILADALRYEIFDIAIRVLELERYSLFINTPVKEASLDANMAEMARIKRAQRLQTSLAKEYYSLFIQVREQHMFRLEGWKGRLEAQVAPILKIERHTLGHFKSRLYFLRIKSIYQQLMGKAYDAYETRKLILDLWHQHPWQKADDPTNHIISLSNMLASCHMVGDYVLYRQVLRDLEATKPNSSMAALEKRNNLLYYSFLYHLNQGDLSACAALCDPLEILADNHSSLARRITIQYNLAVFHFVMQEWQKCLKLLNQILHEDKSQQRQDVVLFSRILMILVYYEKDNMDVMDYLFSNAVRTLRRRGRLERFEKAIFQFLRQVLKLQGAESHAELLAPLFKDLGAQRMEMDKEGAGYPPGFVELLIWLDCKVQGDTIRDAFQRFTASQKTSD